MSEGVEGVGQGAKASTILVEKAVDGSGRLWMRVRLIQTHPQECGQLSSRDAVVIHKRLLGNGGKPTQERGWNSVREDGVGGQRAIYPHYPQPLWLWTTLFSLY